MCLYGDGGCRDGGIGDGGSVDCSDGGDGGGGADGSGWNSCVGDGGESGMCRSVGGVDCVGVVEILVLGSVKKSL